MPPLGRIERASRAYATAPAKCGFTNGCDYTGQGGICVLCAVSTSSMLAFRVVFGSSTLLDKPLPLCACLYVPLTRIDWWSIACAGKSTKPDCLAHCIAYCTSRFLTAACVIRMGGRRLMSVCVIRTARAHRHTAPVAVARHVSLEVARRITTPPYDLEPKLERGGTSTYTCNCVNRLQQLSS